MSKMNSDYDEAEDDDQQTFYSDNTTAPPQLRSFPTNEAPDLRNAKLQSLDTLTDLLSLPGGEEQAGFDPGRWVVAAGLLEKKRDGRMRDGWAKRWFVLGRHTLYYYLLPKTDNAGFTPLLGDERGQIKLGDVQDVQAKAHDKDHWYLTVTVVQVRKNTAAGYLSTPVSQLQLRTPYKTGKLWMDAILGARDAVRAGAPMPGRLALKGLVAHGSSAESSQVVGPGSGDGGGEVAQVDEVKKPIRPRRGSSAPGGGMDAATMEEFFPLAKRIHWRIFSFTVVVIFCAAFLETLVQNTGLGERGIAVPIWLLQIPFWFWGILLLWVVYTLYEQSRRSVAHDTVARESRFRVSILNKILSEKQAVAAAAIAAAGGEASLVLANGASGATTPGTTEERRKKYLVPMSSSEIIRIEASGEDLGVHVAGSSTTLLARAELKTPGTFMSWCDAEASDFKLRIGPNYKKTGAKASSGEALYTMVGLDLVRSKDRLFNLASSETMVLPAHRPDVDPELDAIKRAGLPRLFIINAQIPDKSPVLMGKAPEDSGYSLVFYFTVKQSTLDELNGSKPLSPAVALLKKYVQEHNTNPDIRRRFKAIGMLDDTKEFAQIPVVGTMIEKFNGKPAIINKVAEIFTSGPDCDWFEVDISIYDFPYLGRKGLYALKDRVSEVGLKAGFVVQGEMDDELPEILLGGGEISGLDFRLAKVL